MFLFYSVEREQLPWKNYYKSIVRNTMERCYIIEIKNASGKIKLSNSILHSLLTLNCNRSVHDF